MFQPFPRYLTSKNAKIGSQQFKGMSEERITHSSTTDNSFGPEINV